MTISTDQSQHRKNKHRGTQSDGRPFSPEQIEAIWQKAHRSMETHPFISIVCKMFSKGFKNGTHVFDDYGHVLTQEAYGKKEKHGWEIDHIHPIEKKESYVKGADHIDDIDNLRVLYWESNERKGKNDARIYELEYEHIILNKSA